MLSKLRDRRTKTAQSFVPQLEQLEALIVPAPIVRVAAGADADAIRATVDLFRADLGNPNNANNPPAATGRREINWDGADTFSSPNTLPPDFFNRNAPRGAIFSFPAGSNGTGFLQSQDDDDPADPDPDLVRFGEFNPQYPTILQTFSPERLFTAIGSNVMDVTFRVPGLAATATTSGFGVVFADVNDATNARIELFDAAGVSLGQFQAPAQLGGLSFVGVTFDAGERVSRVRITSGNIILVQGTPGALDDRTANSDLVVMDDFFYGEPQANSTVQVSAPSFSFSENAGQATVTITRTGIATGAVSVNVTTSNGTALAGFDYLTTAGTITFGPGDTTPKEVTIQLLDNANVDGIRSFNVTLSNVTGDAVLGTQATAAVNLFDNDSPPAQLIGVSANNQVVRFNTNNPGPGTITTVAITGLQDNETIRGIDFRPATGQLFALGSTNRLYTINPDSGVATQVGTGTLNPAPVGNAFAFDFNPLPDRIRLVSDTGQNLRLNPNDGSVTTDTPVAYTANDPNFGTTPNIVGAAYSNNFPGATTTNLYVIDAARNVLALQGSPGGTPTSPNAGTLFTIGPLGFDTDLVVGFDIGPGNLAYAALSAPGSNQSQLFAIDLRSGAAAQIGNIGGAQLVGLTAVLNPTIQFNVSTFTVSEDAGVVNITITRNSSQGEAMVVFNASDGTATGGASVLPSLYFPPAAIRGDYGRVTNQIVTFADGQRTQTVSIPVRDNARSTGNRTVNLALSNAAGAALGVRSTATLTITDNNDNQLSAAQRFVTQAFLDLLNRLPSNAELTTFASQVTDPNSSTVRLTVARNIINTDTFRNDVITQVYNSLLNRNPLASDIDFFNSQLGAQVITIQQLAATVASSAEYFAKNGNTTLNGFINNLFLDTLGRPASPADQAAFAGLNQAQIADLVLVQSTEYTGALVGNFYSRFLSRTPDGGGFFFFTSSLAGTLRNPDGTFQPQVRVEEVLAQIIASPEYFARL